jgi:hypothetical protein
VVCGGLRAAGATGPAPDLMTLTLDMVSAGLPSLTAYLSRPMTREETAKLTKGEMKARGLAQTRICRWRQRMAKAVALCAAPASDRDIIDVYTCQIIDA